MSCVQSAYIRHSFRWSEDIGRINAVLLDETGCAGYKYISLFRARRLRASTRTPAVAAVQCQAATCSSLSTISRPRGNS